MKTFELLYFLVRAACKFSLEGSFLIFRIGTFFSPIMPGMGAIKFFILFYVKLVRNHLFGHKATRAHLSQRHDIQHSIRHITCISSMRSTGFRVLFLNDFGGVSLLFRFPKKM